VTNLRTKTLKIVLEKRKAVIIIVITGQIFKTLSFLLSPGQSMSDGPASISLKINQNAEILLKNPTPKTSFFLSTFE
jgi:hypothetical protein